MLQKILFCLGVLICFNQPAFAYKLTTPFKSAHFAVNQVILEPSEQYNATLKQMLRRDSALTCKGTGRLQVTTAIFPAGSQGFGPINEPVLAVIYASRYSETEKELIDFDEHAGYAAWAGIRLPADSLLSLVNNRTTSSLLDELEGMPLLITNFKVDKKSQDIYQKTYLTMKNKGMVIDFSPIDSLYYTKQQQKQIIKGCKLTVMGRPDRLMCGGEIPLFISMHGAVNDISCRK
ncbi:MAG: hypothetical protein K6F05_06625 [Succinivibrio sp.]|nr:hypothetical protein [Succinivibrio sp.]